MGRWSTAQRVVAGRGVQPEKIDRARGCIRRWRVVEERACALSWLPVAGGEREDVIRECGARSVDLRGVLSIGSARTDRLRRRVCVVHVDVECRRYGARAR